jgi:ribosome-binding ATPase YchF (GTP1/OBG family)
MLKVRVIHAWIETATRELMSKPGKETRGYDPSNDIFWLRSEIVRWIQGNLMDKWWVL